MRQRARAAARKRRTPTGLPHTGQAELSTAQGTTQASLFSPDLYVPHQPLHTQSGTVWFFLIKSFKRLELGYAHCSLTSVHKDCGYVDVATLHTLWAYEHLASYARSMKSDRPGSRSGCHLGDVSGLGLTQAPPTGGLWSVDAPVSNLEAALRFLRAQGSAQEGCGLVLGGGACPCSMSGSAGGPPCLLGYKTCDF